MGVVKSCYVERAVSQEKGTEYSCLVFDVGWRKFRVFCQRDVLQALTGKTLQELYEMKVGEIIPVTFEK